MKNLKTVFCLLLALALLTACGSSAGKPESASASGAGIEPSAAPMSAPEPEESAEPEPVPSAEPEAPEPIVYPTADGQAVQTYDISFYLPESLTANEWNGMLGVYEFYTGEYSGSRPTGLDFTLVVSAESNAGGDLPAYAVQESAKRLDEGFVSEEVEYNGSAWIRCAVGEDQADYYAIFNGGLYEITARRGGDSQENYDAARQMMEDTLFFAVMEE